MGIVVVKHQAVVKCGSGQFRHVLAPGNRVAGDCCYLVGIFPVVHDLCHGKRATTHRSDVSGTVHRTQAVHGFVLSPGALNQGLNNTRTFGSLHGDDFAPVSLHFLDLVLVQLQVILHVTGQVVHVDVALVAVGKHLLSTVVTSNDNPATALDVEHIECVTLHARSLGVSQLQVGKGSSLERSTG